MYILGLDTSNQLLGVAIMKDEQVIGEITTNIARNHSVRLMPAINQLMEDVDMKPEQLDKIVVAKGPGSYTGVRIGLTTAKTMAWALQIPVVGVSSLKVLGYQGKFFDGLICPFFDARRGRVYTGLYQWKDSNLEIVEDERNVAMEEWLKLLSLKEQKILFLSPDMKKHQTTIETSMPSLAVIPDAPAYQMANPSHLILAGENEANDSVYHITPNYLRLAEAEAKWLQAKENHANG